MAQVQLQKLQTINDLRKKLSGLTSTLGDLQSEAERMEAVLDQDLKDFYQQLSKEYQNAANMNALEEDLAEYNATEQDTLGRVRSSVATTVDDYLEKNLGLLVQDIAKKHKGTVQAGSVAKKVLPNSLKSTTPENLADTALRVITDNKDYILDIPLLRSTLIQKVIQQNAL